MAWHDNRMTPSRLVGREHELAAVRRAWTAVGTQGVQVVLIRGEAGIGKTSLARTFTADVDATVVAGQSVALGADPMPFVALSQVLRGVVAEFGSEAVMGWAGDGGAALAGMLPGVAAPGRVAGEVRMQTFEAVADVFEGAARLRPLVVIIEDLHWADVSTGHMLRFLGAALVASPVLLLVTYRSEELVGRHPLRPVVSELARRANSHSVDLLGLDEASVAEIVRPLLPQSAAAATTARIIRQSDGVPFFAEELALATGGQGRLPSTLREAVLTRVHWLSEPTQEVLRVAAVSGVEFDDRVLLAATGLAPRDLDAALREAMDAGIVTVEPGYAFRHALVREAIHDELLPGEHNRLHSHLADLLIAQPELGAARSTSLAHHLRAANRLDEAFRACLDRVAEIGVENVEGLRLCELALELWERVEAPEQVMGGRDMLLERLARAAAWLGDGDRAHKYIEASLAEMPPETDAYARSRRLRLKARAVAAPATAVEIAQEALAVCPAEPPSLELAEAYDMLAHLLQMGGRKSESMPVVASGLRVARAVGAKGTEANLLVTLASDLCGIGDFAAGFEMFERGRAVTPDRPMMRYSTNLSHYLNLAGDFRRAVSVAAEGVVAARSLGLERYVGCMVAGNTAEPLVALGEWAEAETLLRRALALDPQAEYGAQLRWVLAELATYRGQFVEAARLLDEIEAESVGSPQERFHHAWISGLLAIVRGDWQAAWDRVQASSALRGFQEATLPYRLLCIGAAAARRGQIDAAWDSLEAARAKLPTGLEASVWETWFIAERDDSADSWQHALDTTPERRHVALTAWLQAGLADRLRRDGDAGAARTVAQQGVRAVEPLGADALVRLLRESGGLTAPRTTAAGPADVLTPREREVLGFVAQGRTNGEIGKHLHLSTKTVSVHVSNILAKLGLAGRGEAAAWAHAQGLVPRAE